MYYEKMGIAVLKPKIKDNTLNTFDVELTKSEGISRQTCHDLGGNWIDDPTGEGCRIEIHDVIDVAMDNMVFGRIFTDNSSFKEVMKTDYYTLESSRGASLQFDCGYGTSDLNVNVTPSVKNFKNLDMACKIRPSGASSGGIMAVSPKGFVATYPKKETSYSSSTGKYK